MKFWRLKVFEFFRLRKLEIWKKLKILASSGAEYYSATYVRLQKLGGALWARGTSAQQILYLK